MARSVGGIVRSTFIAALIGTAILVACSDSDRPPSNPGVIVPGVPTGDATFFEGGGEGGSDGGTDGPPQDIDAGACLPRTQLCTEPLPGTAAGPITGGTLAAGTYVLVGTAGNPTNCHTLYIGDGFIHDVEVKTKGVDGGPDISDVQSGSFEALGAALTITSICPIGGVRASVGYGFDGTNLTISYPTGLGGRTDVYRKQ